MQHMCCSSCGDARTVEVLYQPNDRSLPGARPHSWSPPVDKGSPGTLLELLANDRKTVMVRAVDCVKCAHDKWQAAAAVRSIFPNPRTYAKLAELAGANDFLSKRMLTLEVHTVWGGIGMAHVSDEYGGV